jgi:hypothetical protein
LPFEDYGIILHHKVMENEIFKKLEEQGRKIEEIFVSVEKTRKYLLWTLIISAAFVILPIVGLMFAIPQFFNNLDAVSGLGL